MMVSSSRRKMKDWYWSSRLLRLLCSEILCITMNDKCSITVWRSYSMQAHSFSRWKRKKNCFSQRSRCSLISLTVHLLPSGCSMKIRMNSTDTTTKMTMRLSKRFTPNDVLQIKVTIITLLNLLSHTQTLQGIVGHIFQRSTSESIMNAYSHLLFNGSIDINTSMPLITIVIKSPKDKDSNRSQTKKVGVMQCINPKGLQSLVFTKHSSAKDIPDSFTETLGNFSSILGDAIATLTF